MELLLDDGKCFGHPEIFTGKVTLIILVASSYKYLSLILVMMMNFDKDYRIQTHPSNRVQGEEKLYYKQTSIRKKSRKHDRMIMMNSVHRLH